MPVAASQPCLPRPSLMLSLLLGLAGAAGEQELQVTQRETSVSVTAGEAVTLSCVVSSPQPVGPVQWFKGNGPDRQLVYSFKGGLDRVRLFPRVTNVTDQTIRGNTDYSIRIMDMSTEDSGIYYCVKFRKGSPEDVEFKSGPGTLVTVNAKPSPPKVSGPSKRTSPGQVVNLTCTSTGFFPRNISLKWLENGMEIPALQTLVLPPGDASSYTVISTTQVTLTISSLHSQVTCQVAHSELQGLLSGHVTMSQFLQVMPTVRASAHPIPSLQAAILICHVQRFYPEGAHITWLERNHGFETCEALAPTTNPDGTFSQDSHLLVNTSEWEDKRLFTCQVRHNAQPPIQASMKLSELREKEQASLGPRTSSSLYGMVLLLCWKLFSLTVLSTLYIVRRTLPSRKTHLGRGTAVTPVAVTPASPASAAF
ncbi:signal-regulatory protein beta-1-like isoform X3 [Elephas maximus indicus]|uniref:signal-regulatory protein beta-1-like isoform X3 n=1 Tax=Elephas maximus indicus TaxID=99487 RepID=UPI0021167123|nr:signal-regulatory protein beta-1-like isoform X3 [Elephas maximus indicus]